MKLAVLGLLVGLVGSAFGQGVGAGVAAQPPLGWNSWDSYGLTITEEQFKANVEVEATRLKPAGYRYAVIDEGWFLVNPQDRNTPDKLVYAVDRFGRYVPVPARFPSAGTAEASSFKALGEYVHGQGLRFGIHIVRGIPRESVKRDLPVEGSAFKASDVADKTDVCPWDPTNWGVKDTPAGQAWYDSLLRQYAGWGVDFLKVDCISSHPYKPAEIAMIRRAIDKTGRPMVLSLSPGPTALTDAAGVKAKAQMWRIADDFWDYWRTGKDYPHAVADMFQPLAAWAPYAGPGNWPDADMLPLGHLGPHVAEGEGGERETRLTHDEQRTLMTLWGIAKSPLILGNNLTQMDDWTYKLVTNAGVLEANQVGHGERQVSSEGGIYVWRSEGGPGQGWVAVFNTTDAAVTVRKPLSAFGLEGRYRLENLWEGGAAKTAAREMDVAIAPHGCSLMKWEEAKVAAR